MENFFMEVVAYLRPPSPDVKPEQTPGTSAAPNISEPSKANEPEPAAPASASRHEALPDDLFNLERAERLLVQRALEAGRGNKSRAAALLGVTREGLRKKLLRLGIRAEKEKDGEE